MHTYIHMYLYPLPGPGNLILYKIPKLSHVISPLDKGDLSQRSLRAGTNGLVGLVRTPAPWQHPVAWAVVLVTQGIPGE